MKRTVVFKDRPFREKTHKITSEQRGIRHPFYSLYTLFIYTIYTERELESNAFVTENVLVELTGRRRVV